MDPVTTVLVLIAFIAGSVAYLVAGHRCAVICAAHTASAERRARNAAVVRAMARAEIVRYEGLRYRARIEALNAAIAARDTEIDWDSGWWELARDMERV